MDLAHKRTAKPAKEEIDGHVQKLMVGVMALTLPWLAWLFAGAPPIGSISESYWRPGWGQTIFLGFLFAIAAFLFAYNGQSTVQMIMSKIASVAALCVALFPCDCAGHTEVIKRLHFIAAAVMFVILAFFCYTFYDRALHRPKSGRKTISSEARFRAGIYAFCGMVIVGVIGLVLLDWLTEDKTTHIGWIVARWSGFIFWAETIGLVYFGIAWLVASRTLPILTADFERYSLNPYVSQEEKDSR